MPKTLAEMSQEVAEWTKRKGWWDDGRTFGDMIALLHSECSEALEEYRDHGYEVYYSQSASGEKPEGVSVEIADLFIRMLHMAAWFGWDLEELYELKMAYNEKRSFRHGNKAL